MNAIERLLKNPYIIFNVLNKWNLLNWMPDEMYLRTIYRARIGKKLNLENPKTFNEKIQWMKINNREEQHDYMIDKYLAKEYVGREIGEKYLIPTIGVWEKFENIDFSRLPNQFVMKCTHDSGGIIICRDKDKLDLGKVRKKINNSLKQNYYWKGREISYKTIKPRIMVEKYLEDGDSKYLRVYKIMCFGGKPKVIKVIQNDHTDDQTVDFFDTEWRLLPFRQNYLNSKVPPKKPKTLEQMFVIAEKLAKGYSYLRVDLYEINSEVYFSEISYFSDSGFAAFYPEEWDKKLGDNIIL